MNSNEQSRLPTISGEAWPNGENASGPRQQAQERNSVFDFLYHDARRVASFLSQFSAYGALTGVKATEASGRADTLKTTGELNAKLPLLGGGRAAFDRGNSVDERESAERSYDPIWANAIQFMDFAEERGLVQRNIAQARIGQIVLLSGDLSLFDFGMLGKALELKTFKKYALQSQQAPSNRHARRAQNGKGYSVAGAPPSETEAGIEMMSIVPHLVQASINGDEGIAWATLREEWLTIPPADILLKHGIAIPGRWSALGILDALPDFDDAPDPEAGLTSQTIINALAGSQLNQIGHLFAGAVAPAIRTILGRPVSSYGITPLVIFREVLGAAPSQF